VRTEGKPVASPPRIASQQGDFGELVRAALRSTPALDQAAAFRTLLERSHASHRTRRAKTALAFALACLALTAAAALWIRVRNPAAPALVESSASARPEPILLVSGDTRLEDGTRVHLEAQGSARLETTASGSRIALESGVVTLEVARQRSGRTLEVRSGSYRFVVLGTAFTVSSSPGRVAASVSEGRVAVFRDQTRLAELAAGETWSSDGRPPPPPEPAVTTAPPSARAAEPLLRSPPTDRDARDSTPPPVAVPGPDCLSLARAGRARDAERCFAEQAAGDGLSAELALSELSRLRSDVLGDAAGALQALEQHRARFPSGSLRAEVDLSYVHLLARAGRSREVLDESSRLLRSGAAREREGELRMLRGNTLRTKLQDFATAAREYELVERGGSKFAGEAAYYRGVCFEALGDRSAAAEAYRRYLRVPGRPREAEARRRLTTL
jgi:hypothetical protein